MLRQLIGRAVDGWLNRFRTRHGLNGSPPAQTPSHQRLLLHVGCGYADKNDIIAYFQGDAWNETRLDADPAVLPDIVGSMSDMGMVADGTYHAVYSSHGIEHLYWHDVPRALQEFRRVLRDDGFLVICCPDLQTAAEWIAQDRLFETVYRSPAGEITPFDIVYSFRPFVAANPRWMSHHCGFTLSSLTAILREAGFRAIYGFRRAEACSLWVLACKQPLDEDALKTLAQDILPPRDRD